MTRRRLEIVPTALAATAAAAAIFGILALAGFADVHVALAALVVASLVAVPALWVRRDEPSRGPREDETLTPWHARPVGPADSRDAWYHDLTVLVGRVRSEFIAEGDQAAVFERLLFDLLTITDSRQAWLAEVRSDAMGATAIDMLAAAGADRVGWPSRESLDALFTAVSESRRELVMPPALPGQPGLGEPVLALPLRSATEVVGVLALGGRSVGYPRELIDALQPVVVTCEQILEASRLEARRIETERALREARDHAEAAARAKADFLANMSHEIRTPINAVVGLTGLLLETRLEPEQRELADTVREAGDALLLLVNDILDYSKIESGHVELEHRPFDVHDLVEHAIELLVTSAASKALELAYVVEPSVPRRLVGDITRLRQVLVNLIGNAVKFTPRGRVEVVASSHQTCDGSVALVVSVSDTGIGIPADRLGRLFQKFTQVDASTTRRFGGTGLGLAISDRIIRLMGGRIDVESVPNRGSTFTVTVDLDVAPAEADDGSEGPSLEGRRVVIVDPHEVSARHVASLVERWGATTVTATGLDTLPMPAARAQDTILVVDVRVAGQSVGHPAGVAAGAVGDTANMPTIVLVPLHGAEVPPSAGGADLVVVRKPIKRAALGTAFRRLVDRADPCPSLIDVPPGEMSGVPRKPLRVLLAEDHPVNRKVALKMLSHLGYHAEVSVDGEEVLTRLAQERFDVVLLDVQMPRVDGFEVARRVRHGAFAHRPRLVGMTALAMAGDRQRCLDAGMDDYLAKPARLEDLRALLTEATLSPSSAATPAVAINAADHATWFDPEALATLRSLQEPDEPDFVSELIDHLLAEAPHHVAAIVDHAEAGLSREVERVAHGLKSAAGNLGASSLAAACERIEAAAAAGRLSDVEGDITGLRAELDRVSARLAVERQASCGPTDAVA